MKKWILILVLFGFICNFSSCKKQNQTVDNLAVFTKLYGYIRFFHPSDEASSIDWDKFAVFGAGKVKIAKNREELHKILKQLFYPIAPTLQIYKKGDTPKSFKHPQNTNGLYPVFWQHYGVGLNKDSVYKSVRVGRRKPADSQSRGIILSFMEKKFKNKKFKINAMIKAEVTGANSYGNLFFILVNNRRKRVIDKNFHDKPIKKNRWTQHSITGTIPDDMLYFYFGTELEGSGKLWVDDFEFFISGEGTNWEKVTLKNPGFEKEIKNEAYGGWYYSEMAYIFKRTEKEKSSGSYSLLIQNNKDVLPGCIFKWNLKPGEVVQKGLGSNLFCQVPLALWANDQTTMGKNSNKGFKSLVKELARIDLKGCTPDKEDVRFGNIVIAWNIFQHFYPYFDVVKVNWEKTLKETLRDLLDDQTAEDFNDSLKRMLAKLEDGHGYTRFKSKVKKGGLPIIRVEYIEKKLVITATEDNTVFKKGDIIKSIDGKNSMEVLIEREKYISGSPQLRRYRALNQYGSGPVGSMAKLELIRDGNSIQVEMKRKEETRGLFFNRISEFDFPDIKELEPGIYYINSNTTDKKEFTRRLDELSQAKGIILDTRWDGKYDRNKERLSPEQDIFTHLIDEKADSAWWNIPQIIYPDFQNVTFHKSNWSIQPKKPRFKGKFVTIILPHVVSYGETCMGIYEHYKLGETVGKTTAGCNGNVNPFTLMGGYRVSWTGMKVLKHDGSQHHLVGIRPTYPVRKTIKAVKEGRDEYLEKAIEIIKSQDKNN